jgi:release factor glutamine methyltransferase
MPRSSSLSSLLARLAAHIGRNDAAHELRWLRQSLPSPASHSALGNLLSQRIHGKPLQYIIGASRLLIQARISATTKGTVPFGHLELKVRQPTLIPRPETEEWTLRLAKTLLHSKNPPPSWNIIDLCTGSGCIPLLLCSLLPRDRAYAVAVDVSQEACDLATENAALRFNTEPVSFRVLRRDITDISFLEQFAPNSFHVLTCNPPYIPYKEFLALPRSVKDFEDPGALLGDPDPLANNEQDDGLHFYSLLAKLVPSLLVSNGGICAMEVGAGQALAVQTMMRDTGFFLHVDIWHDAAGIGRTVVATN